MVRTRTVSGEIVVDAPPERLYALVADPVGMARWSPENTGAITTRPGPAQVGDRFTGTNRRGPAARWVTGCVVTAAEPGVRFAFTVDRIGVRRPVLRAHNASWEYRFEPAGEGTRVIETWTDDRPWPDGLAAVVDRVLTGGRTFAEHQRRNIRSTLERLRADVESGG